MTNFLYNTGSKELWDGTIAILSATIKAMLAGSAYSANRDDDVVDTGGASDPVDAELTGTGSLSGYGNRKTLASKTITVDKTNDRSEFDCADITWTAIGATTPAAATQLLIIKEGGSNDTTSRLISHHDFAVTPNGGDITAQIAGLIRLAT